MPHLLTLDGRPQTWAELKARNEAWWARPVPNESAVCVVPKPQPWRSARMSWNCWSKLFHRRCKGTRQLNAVGDGRRVMGPCGCECHEVRP